MNDSNLDEMEKLFTALADKTRLRLLNLMRRNEVCVCFFTEALGESQPKISRHLAFLRAAGIVEARRDGKWIHYRICATGNEYVERILRDALEWLSLQREMQEDFENFARICRAPIATATITRAPRPEILRETNMSPEKRELETFLL